MEKFNETLEARNLKPSSISTYNSNLKKLMKDLKVDFTGAETIHQNTTKILTLLDTKKLSVKKNYLAVILIILSPLKKYPTPQNKDLYNFFNNMMKELNGKYLKNLQEKKLSSTDQENFITMSELKEQRDIVIDRTIRKIRHSSVITNADFMLLQDAFILSLYSYFAPRRLIFASAKKIALKDYKKLSESELSNNVYLVHTAQYIPKIMHYGRNATKSRTPEDVIVPFEHPTHKIITKLFLKFTKVSNHLLLQTDGETKMNENGLSKRLSKIFKMIFNKKISVVLLRKLYVSQTITSSISPAEQERIAEQMNHTTATQVGVYKKELVNEPTEVIELDDDVKPKYKFKVKK